MKFIYRTAHISRYHHHHFTPDRCGVCHQQRPLLGLLARTRLVVDYRKADASSVKVEGRENIKAGESYVFVANHQGAFDIFLIYGFLNRNFKWMMKHGLATIPIIGQACRSSHQIIVDKRGASKIKKTYDEARETLKEGMSVVVFPEGARTFTGHMGFFRRGAFMLADELQLPVCPLTINGSFNIMPRMKDWHWVNWHPLTLTIHKPIHPIGKGRENIDHIKDKSYEAIMSSLVPEYQGYVENKDQ